jgi:hypothetical protein
MKTAQINKMAEEFSEASESYYSEVDSDSVVESDESSDDSARRELKKMSNRLDEDESSYSDSGSGLDSEEESDSESRKTRKSKKSRVNTRLGNRKVRPSKNEAALKGVRHKMRIYGNYAAAVDDSEIVKPIKSFGNSDLSIEEFAILLQKFYKSHGML